MTFTTDQFDFLSAAGTYFLVCCQRFSFP